MPPILPINKYIDHIAVTNAVASIDLASRRLARSARLSGGRTVRPACHAKSLHAARHGPHGMRHACPIVDDLFRDAQQRHHHAGRRNQRGIRLHQKHVLTLYAGKKVGDLVLSWVSQEQGDVQLIGYIEGAPPCPMANMTNKPATTFLEPKTVYPGATSITLTAPHR